MIKANELRIGNIVLFYNYIEPKTEVVINARFFTTLAGGRDLSEVKPDEPLNHYWRGIPITPEILVRCGFERKLILGSTDKYWYSLGELSYNESHEGWWFRGKFKDIKYLHQLQNIYFTLTGEELQIKSHPENKAA